MYAKFIDYLRKIVVFAFGISGIGLIVCSNRSPLLATTFEFIVLACLITAFGLFVEYLIRSFLEVRPNGLAKNQFSLGESLVGITLFAVLLSCYKILGNAFWPLGILSLAILGCIIEAFRRKSAADAKQAAGDLSAPHADPHEESAGGPKSTNGENE